MPMPEILRSLVGMGVELEPVIPEDSLRAAELIEHSRRARQRAGDSSLSLGDGLCIAVAERLGLPLTGGDQLWERLSLKVKYHAFR